MRNSTLLLLACCALNVPAFGQECKNVTAIHDVQGSGAKSPLSNRGVRISGVVTGDFQNRDKDIISTLRGFYMQELVADDDPATSEGIFVFDGSNPKKDVQVGDKVCVHGKVQEYFGETQINAKRVIRIGEGSVAPTFVEFPVATTLNSNDARIADLEAYEGMLVTFPGQLTVSSLHDLDRFGEIQLAGGGRHHKFTDWQLPDREAYEAHSDKIASNTILLDDGIDWQNPPAIRYALYASSPGDIKGPRLGDVVVGLTGNLRYSRGSTKFGPEGWRLEPVREPRFIFKGDHDRISPEVGGSLRVASFNVLNFFTRSAADGRVCGPRGKDGCRGATDDQELQRQQKKTYFTVAALNADLTGLVELENNDRSLAVLTEGVNAQAGTKQYSYVATGAIGEDAIKVGIMYRNDKLRPVGDFAVLNSAVDSRFNDQKNRPVLAQSFMQISNGEVFTFAVAHMKSKGSDCNKQDDPDLQDGQGNCNLTRLEGAKAIVDWLAARPTTVDDDDVLLVGDFNAHSLEDPIRALTGGGFTNLLRKHVGPTAYSYAYNGTLGLLDYAFSNAPLDCQVTSAVAWHINADFADLFDYNLDFKRSPKYFDATTPYRSSDHDPVLIGLDLGHDCGTDLK